VAETEIKDNRKQVFQLRTATHTHLNVAQLHSVHERRHCARAVAAAAAAAGDDVDPRPHEVVKRAHALVAHAPQHRVVLPRVNGLGQGATLQQSLHNDDVVVL
jgi:chorismate mutase